MVFKWRDPGSRMDGEGTLEEYFSPATWAPDPTVESDDLMSAFENEMDDRNNHLDRLQLQLFTEFSGIDKTEHVTVVWPESSRTARYYKKRKGLNLVCVQSDDPIIGLFKDGQPIAGFYASYRGMYQAGGYIVESDRYVFAHDGFTEEFAGTKNEWHDRNTICGDIAHDFMTGDRRWTY